MPSNRLASVTDANGATTYSYDAVGNLAGYAYPNGVEHAYTYNALNRLTDLEVTSASTPIARYAYGLGPSGNRLSVTELSGRRAAYGYDALYRLTSETVTGDPGGVNGTVGYVYDSVGNRLTRSSTVAPIPAQSFGYDANDRIAVETYDDNGNTLVTTEGRNFGYDSDNRLATADGGVSFVYDGDGNRVAKTAGGVTTRFLVDTLNPTGYSQVLEEIENGVVVRRYTYGLDLVSQEQSTGVSFYGYDGHGSVRLLTDAAGAVTDTYAYDAFGNLSGRTGATGNVYLYGGEQVESHLNRYYLRSRFYQQDDGRFCSIDLYGGNIFEPQQLHKYLYAHADPQNRIDPTGEFSLTELSVVSAVTGTLYASYVAYQEHSLGYSLTEAKGRILGAFLTGAVVGAGSYSVVAITQMFAATSIPTAMFWADPRVRNALEGGARRVMQATSQDRWNHAAKHLVDELKLFPSRDAIIPLAESVLLRPEFHSIVRQGQTSAVAFAARVPVNGVLTWVSVAVYTEGTFIGQVAGVVIPTTQQLLKHGIPWWWLL